MAESDTVRIVPLPDTAPTVAEPVPGSIVKSDASKVPGSELNVKVMYPPAEVAVQVMPVTGPTSALETLPECPARVTLTPIIEP